MLGIKFIVNDNHKNTYNVTRSLAIKAHQMPKENVRTLIHTKTPPKIPQS